MVKKSTSESKYGFGICDTVVDGAFAGGLPFAHTCDDDAFCILLRSYLGSNNALDDHFSTAITTGSKSYHRVGFGSVG